MNHRNTYSEFSLDSIINRIIKRLISRIIQRLPDRNVGVTPLCVWFGNFVYLADISLDPMVLKNPKLLRYALLVYILLVTCYLLSVIRYVLYVISSLVLSVISYIYNALGVTRYRYACSVYRNVGFGDQYNIQLNN